MRLRSFKTTLCGFLFAGLFFASADVHAEGGALTLDQAISEATLNSPTLKGLQATVGEYSWKKLESLSSQLPQFTLDAEHYLDLEWSRVNDIPRSSPTTTFTLGTTLLLFDGLSTISTYQASDFAYEATKDDLSFSRFLLEQQVRVLFYEALGARDFVSVAGQNIKTLSDHLKIAKANEQTGTGTHFDVLRIQAQLAEAIAEKKLQDDNTVIARTQLAQALGLEDDTRTLSGKLPIPSAQKIPKDILFSTQDREDIQAELNRARSAQKLKTAYTAGLLPKFTLAANKQYYRFGDYDPAVTPTEGFDDAYAVSVKMSWNILNGGLSVAKQREASYASLRANENAHSATLKAPAQFDLWKRRYFYNTELYHARLSTIRESQEAVRLAILGLETGTRTHTEVLDAELQLFRARAGAVQAQLDAAEALANLELYRGKRVD